VTTIVYRGGRMAADSRAYAGDKHPIGSKVKLKRMDDGTLIGVSTTTPGGGEAVIRWYAKGRPEDITVPEHFTMLAAHKNGEVYYATGGDFVSGPLEADFFSIGSGEQYAQGALEMGASAVEAVRVACKCDTFTGPPIYEITHRSKTLWRIDE
jgi:hypothetical protein